MGRKKKFIEKGEGVKFYLVHRSQKDPLYLDENLGEHVLMPADSDVNSYLVQAVNGMSLNNNKSKSEKDEIKNKRLEEQQKFGIYYDDDYDYLQHLKEVDDEENYELDEAVQIGNVIIKNDPLSQQKLTLPSSVFASKFEEETGYFNQAAPNNDPKIGWDPDIVRLLDDDTNIDFEDKDNELEDDFFVKANDIEKPEIKNQSLDDDYREDYEDDSDDGRFENNSECQSVKEFETKSRFSNYSMSSSVIRRNEKLQYLDDHFEKIFAQYDEDQIGKNILIYLITLSKISIIYSKFLQKNTIITHSKSKII
jgi:protein LTV1